MKKTLYVLSIIAAVGVIVAGLLGWL